MSSEQRAGHLARLKVTFPLWRITRATDDGTGYFARRDEATLWAETLAGLEVALADAEAHPPPGS